MKRSYHVGLRVERHARGSRAVFEFRRCKDLLDCEILEYCGERETSVSAAVKRLRETRAAVLADYRTMTAAQRHNARQERIYEAARARAINELQKIFPDATEQTWHQHTNGGGWVQNTCTVEASVYICSNAWVYGNAQVYGNARNFSPLYIQGTRHSVTVSAYGFKKRRSVSAVIRLQMAYAKYRDVFASGRGYSAAHDPECSTA